MVKVVESVHRTYLNDLPLIHGLIAITVSPSMMTSPSSQMAASRLGDGEWWS